jgi:hypothetical protein
MSGTTKFVEIIIDFFSIVNTRKNIDHFGCGLIGSGAY